MRGRIEWGECGIWMMMKGGETQRTGVEEEQAMGEADPHGRRLSRCVCGRRRGCGWDWWVVWLVEYKCKGWWVAELE